MFKHMAFSLFGHAFDQRPKQRLFPALIGGFAVSGKCSASQFPCCFHSDVARLRGQREVTGWQTVCAGINRYADNALQWLASQLHRAQVGTSGMLCGSRARLSGSSVSPSVLTNGSTPRAARAGRPIASRLGAG